MYAKATTNAHTHCPPKLFLHTVHRMAYVNVLLFTVYKVYTTSTPQATRMYGCCNSRPVAKEIGAMAQLRHLTKTVVEAAKSPAIGRHSFATTNFAALRFG